MKILLMFSEGEIVESGTYDQLVEKGEKPYLIPT